MEMVKAQLSTTKPLSGKEFGNSMFPQKFGSLRGKLAEMAFQQCLIFDVEA